jgi:5-methylcytosine-specific restriction endonuclease McrA
MMPTKPPNRQAMRWKEIVWAAILKRDGTACYFCRREFQTGQKMHIHHRIPVKIEGPDDLDNLTLAHAHCHLSFHTSTRHKRIVAVF